MSELAMTLKAFAKPKQCEPENAESAEPSHPSPRNFFALSATSAFQKSDWLPGSVAFASPPTERCAATRMGAPRMREKRSSPCA